MQWPFKLLRLAHGTCMARRFLPYRRIPAAFGACGHGNCPGTARKSIEAVDDGDFVLIESHAQFLLSTEVGYTTPYTRHTVPPRRELPAQSATRKPGTQQKLGHLRPLYC